MTNKYEREIEELLKRLERHLPSETPLQRAARRFGLWLLLLREALLYRRWGTSPGQLMLTSFVLILGSYFLRFIFPLLGRYVGAAGVTLFLVAFGWSLFHTGRHPQEKRWRGRIVEYPKATGQWLRWLQSLFKGRPRR